MITKIEKFFQNPTKKNFRLLLSLSILFGIIGIIFEFISQDPEFIQLQEIQDEIVFEKFDQSTIFLILSLSYPILIMIFSIITYIGLFSFKK